MDLRPSIFSFRSSVSLTLSPGLLPTAGQWSAVPSPNTAVRLGFFAAGYTTGDAPEAADGGGTPAVLRWLPGDTAPAVSHGSEGSSAHRGRGVPGRPGCPAGGSGAAGAGARDDGAAMPGPRPPRRPRPALPAPPRVPPPPARCPPPGPAYRAAGSGRRRPEPGSGGRPAPARRPGTGTWCRRAERSPLPRLGDAGLRRRTAVPPRCRGGGPSRSPAPRTWTPVPARVPRGASGAPAAAGGGGAHCAGPAHGQGTAPGARYGLNNRARNNSDGVLQGEGML